MDSKYLFLFIIANLAFQITAIGQPDTDVSIEQLQDEVLKMNIEMATLDQEMKSAKELAEIKDNTIGVIRQQLHAKNLYIEQLQKNLKASKDLYEKQKLAMQQFKEIKQKDSIRTALIIAEMSTDIDNLKSLFIEMQEAHMIEIARLENLVLQQSFVITGLLKSTIINNRPEAPIVLDPDNNYQVKARFLEAAYLNFEAPRPENYLPEYRYSVKFIDEKGNNLDIISGGPVPRKNTIKQKLDFEGAGNGFKFKSGRYVVILSYEENQKTHELERIFTLD